MKNGTPFNKTPLLNDASQDADGADADFAVTEPRMAFTEEDADAALAPFPPAGPALIYVAVSAACAVAAIAAGSYALWLTRQKVARETLSNVQDLLKICQDRMHQMEDDLNLLPVGLSAVKP